MPKIRPREARSSSRCTRFKGEWRDPQRKLGFPQAGPLADADASCALTYGQSGSATIEVGLTPFMESPREATNELASEGVSGRSGRSIPCTAW
jgi:hypothetical protein